MREKPGLVVTREDEPPALTDLAHGVAPGSAAAPSIPAVFAAADRSRAGSPVEDSPALPPHRPTTKSAVVAWTIRVNRTTPKVMPWSWARLGKSSGSDSARAVETAPRRPD